MCGCCPTFVALSLCAFSSIYLLWSARRVNPRRALAGMRPHAGASLAVPPQPVTHLTFYFPVQMRTIALTGTQTWWGLLSPAQPRQAAPHRQGEEGSQHICPSWSGLEISRERGWESKPGLRPACAWSQTLFCHPTSLLTASHFPSCGSCIHAYGTMRFEHLLTCPSEPPSLFSFLLFNFYLFLLQII